MSGVLIVSITLCEAEFVFLVSAAGLLFVIPFLMSGASWPGLYVLLALLLGCLASPTAPSATLAVVREYGAQGAVTSTILGVTAFDDVLGIVNFSIATSISQMLRTDGEFTLTSSLWHPAEIIGGAILCGVAFGFAFNALTRLLHRETEGAWIVAVLAVLSLTSGVALSESPRKVRHYVAGGLIPKGALSWVWPSWWLGGPHSPISPESLSALSSVRPSSTNWSVPSYREW